MIDAVLYYATVINKGGSMLTSYTIEGFENIQYQGFKALRQIENKLNDLFKSYGYHQIATPTFEAYDLYANEDAIPSDDLFKLVNHQGKVLALKPDATLPVARMAAINHHNPEEIIKFSYLTNIYRNFSSPDTVKKEITQMGVEYFGNERPECDGEIIALAIESLIANGVTDIQIDLGHVGFINYLLDELSMTQEERSTLFRLIDNKNIGDIRDFLQEHRIDPAIGKIIVELPMLYGHPTEVFAKMEKLCVNARMEAVVTSLKAIYHHLDIVGLAGYITFDLGFTSQMNYYSDIIFKAYVGNWGEPVIDGGRYDTMSEKFGISRPACGFGIDVLSLMDYLEQHSLLVTEPSSHRVILYYPMDKCQTYRLASRLRLKGEITETFKIEDSPEDVVRSLCAQQLYRKADYYLVRDGGFFQWEDGCFAPADAICGLKGDCQ